MDSRFPGRFLQVLALAVVASGCAPSKPADVDRDTMTLAEMRMNDAGGPSKAAVPSSIVSPVGAPSAPGPGALTDAGANTPLGKQWIFASIDGLAGTLPQAPRNASILMSRESGRVVGTTMCNRLSAAFEINVVQGTLAFRNIVTGNAMCGRTEQNIEDAVVEALRTCDSFRLDGKNLTLLSGGATVAELVNP